MESVIRKRFNAISSGPLSPLPPLPLPDPKFACRRSSDPPAICTPTARPRPLPINSTGASSHPPKRTRPNVARSNPPPLANAIDPFASSPGALRSKRSIRGVPPSRPDTVNAPVALRAFAHPTFARDKPMPCKLDVSVKSGADGSLRSNTSLAGPSPVTMPGGKFTLKVSRNEGPIVTFAATRAVPSDPAPRARENVAVPHTSPTRMGPLITKLSLST